MKPADELSYSEGVLADVNLSVDPSGHFDDLANVRCRGRIEDQNLPGGFGQKVGGQGRKSSIQNPPIDEDCSLTDRPGQVQEGSQWDLPFSIQSDDLLGREAVQGFFLSFP